MLPISDTYIQTIIFSLLLLVGVLLSMRKSEKEKTSFLESSNEIKGVAMLMVVFAHIGYQLDATKSFLFPLSVFGGVAVNVFLFLSGYGGTLDMIKNPLTKIQFYKRRVARLLPAFWIALILIIILDFFFTDRSYSFTHIILSFLGLFPSADILHDINSPLWYMSIIFFYYFLLPFIFIRKIPYISALILFGISYLLLYNIFPNYNFIKPDVIQLYKLHMFAFPLGMIIGAFNYNYSKTFILDIFKRLKKYNVLNGIILVSLIYFVYYTGLHSGVGKGVWQEQTVSLITSAGLILFFYFKRFDIKLLSLLGIFSYEIYLIHWPLLSHYYSLYNFGPASLITILYILIFLGIGYCIQKGAKFILTKLGL